MSSETKTAPSASLVLPTYNERENIEQLIPVLEEKFKRVPHEIIVVDDSSPDGTGDVVRELAKRVPHLRLITRPGKNGIGGALREGYDAAVNDIIVSSDVDFSFSPDDLVKLYAQVAGGTYDLAVGSRHIAAAAYEIPRPSIALKFAVSRLGNTVFQTLFRMPVHDFSANCRAIRREIWRSIRTADNGNFFLFEMIYRAHKAGARIGEIPITFTDRRHGTSKINHVAEAPKAFFKMLLLLLHR